MQRAKAFLCVCVGLFLLTLTYHLGAGRADAQSGAAPDIAVLSGTVSDGGTIPLPHYADGSEAPESECRWIVSTHTSTAAMYLGFECATTGRVVTMITAGNSPTQNLANYPIVATRATGPVNAQKRTLGALKKLYR